MLVEFHTKYGKNKIYIPGFPAPIEFNAKYGRNSVLISNEIGTVEFNIKYGKNVIEIPNYEIPIKKFENSPLTNLYVGKVTIYNDIPKTQAENRHFDRFIINGCNVQGGFVGGVDGTTTKLLNAKNVIIRATDEYLPSDQYAKIPVNERANHYTVRIGDFVVFGEVDDVVEDAEDWAALQKTYANNGIKITSFAVSMNGMYVDNITVTNTGGKAE